MARQRRGSNVSSNSSLNDQELGSMYDYLAKVILVGPSGCGKSCLLHRIVKNEWRVLSSQTLGVEFSSKIMKVGTGARRKRIKLQLWDTAGTERFRSISRSYYRGAAGAILVYDLASHASFNALPTFLNDARALASPNLTILLAGNKLDVTSESRSDVSALGNCGSTMQSTFSDNSVGAGVRLSSSHSSIGYEIGSQLTATVATEGRQVTTGEASRWASRSAIPVSVEVSALTGDGVEEIFARLAGMILTKIELGEIDPDDPMSGIQYGDSGGWEDEGSVKSGRTTVEEGGVRRRRRKGQDKVVAIALNSMANRRIIPLNDRQRWSFRQADGPACEWMEVRDMPTNVHLDLVYNSIISNPLIGKNETDCQWVGETPWLYRCTFPTPTLDPSEKAVLVFDGLDTFATVVLNGKEILQSQDMFIPERVVVTPILHSGEENVMDITFDSAYLIGKKFVEQHKSHRWGCWNGDPSRLAVRKAQFHYGWDWGPCLLTCGPWRPINLEAYHSRISDLYFTTAIDKSLKSAEVVVMADIEEDRVGDEVVFKVSLEGKTISAERVTVKKSFAMTTFKSQNPKLWYPHTYGEQPLYVLNAILCRNEALLDTATKRFGLRRAQVIQRKLDDAPGTTFLFEINNIPMFCGGSNWIPTEALTQPVGRKRYHEWVKRAVEGNQIMLRAWGGGIFEDQEFYEACDEMGVLLWQDFLFACGNYPAHEEFLDLVRREAVENVKLLRHHPSIVIWSGNNEDYQYRESEHLEYDHDDQVPENWLRTTFPARYIYEKILVDVTRELVPGTYYHFGSPYGGVNTTDPQVGDIHQWNVWHGTQDKYQDFDRLSGRFVSEFGMEAFPDIRTIDSYLLGVDRTTDRYPQSSTVEFHNKAAGHEGRLALYLAENIPYTLAPFEQYIYCTQLLQAECASSAYKLWKRQWKGPGQEHCSGALIWQLNDCWACTSWSIVDHYLRPKLAYFAVKRELQPITIGLKRIVHTTFADRYTRAYKKTVYKIEMWACNLSLEAHEVFVHVKTYNLVTRELEEHDSLCTRIPLLPNRSTEVSEFELPVSKNDKAKVTELRSEEAQQMVVAAYLYNKTGDQIARAVNWPEPLKHARLLKPKHIKLKLAPKIRDLNPRGAFGIGEDSKPPQTASYLDISSDVPIKGFVLDVVERKGGEEHDVAFEDSGMDLIPGEVITIGVRGLRCGDEDKLTPRYLGSWACETPAS